jgi:hypothetical protein
MCAACACAFIYDEHYACVRAQCVRVPGLRVCVRVQRGVRVRSMRRAADTLAPAIVVFVATLTTRACARVFCVCKPVRSVLPIGKR